MDAVEKKGILNSNAIKLIAVMAMTVDHAAWMLFSGYSTEPLPVIMHIIGRITCPIMCYFIAEGYFYTRNVRRYIGRLLLFALISHFAYRFSAVGADEFTGWQCFVPFYDGHVLNQTSIMWSLAWGLIMLQTACSEKLRSDVLKIILILVGCAISFPSDWSCIAGMYIVCFGTNRGNFKAQMLWMMFYTTIYAAVYCFAMDAVYGMIQMGTVLSIPILGLYNGCRGKNPKTNRIIKWLFYTYYPLHLFLIGWIRFMG